MSSSRSSRRSSRTPRPPISSDSDDNLKFQLDEENTIGRSRKFKTKKWTVQRSVSKSGKPGYKTVAGDDSDASSGSQSSSTPSKPAAVAPPAQPAKSHFWYWMLGGVLIVGVIVAIVIVFMVVLNGKSSANHQGNSTSAASTIATTSSPPVSTTSSSVSTSSAQPTTAPTTTAVSQGVVSAAQNNTSAALDLQQTGFANDTTDLQQIGVTSAAGIQQSGGRQTLDPLSAEILTQSIDEYQPGGPISGWGNDQPTQTLSADAPVTTDFLSEFIKVESLTTWFEATPDVISACNTITTDTDLVIHLSKDLYGDISQISPLCGRWITVWNEGTNQTQSGTVQDYCDDCDKYQLDLSKSMFKDVVQNLDVGVTSNYWWATSPFDNGSYPADGIATVSYHATATSPALQAAITPNDVVTIVETE